MATKWTVVVAGATGLVGRELVRHLAADPRVAQVTALVRTPAGSADAGPAQSAAWPPAVRICRVDWSHLGEAQAALQADAALCALGTTRRQAGSRAAFRQVDLEHVLAFARLTRLSGARAFGVVSAMGADAGSVFFYNRVKGEMEAGLRAMGWPHLVLARPSLLLGERGQARPAEDWAKRLGGLLPPAARPVRAVDVARALADATLAGLASPQGVCVLSNRRMRGA